MVGYASLQVSLKLSVIQDTYIVTYLAGVDLLLDFTNHLCGNSF